MKETLISETLQAYGVDLTRIPTDAAIKPCWDRAEQHVTGIYVETFCFGEHGELLRDESTNDIVTRNVFHPEPKSTQNEAHD